MNPFMQRDIGALITGKAALQFYTANANSTAEQGVEVNGVAIDRNAFNDLMLSAKVMVPVNYSLATAAKVTLVSHFQTADSSTGTWADMELNDGTTAASKVVGSTGSTAAQTGDDLMEYAVDLSGAKRYVRIQVTPTFAPSSTTTDDADIGGVLVFGGADQPPAD